MCPSLSGHYTLLNDKPRKVLSYKTPKAIFESGIINQQKVALRI
ncbi:hypothetical protein CRYPA_472 [uncultured Candidatus Thioglobus sp.]|nr:hypothetical protein CRYPA_472 [uncultured Candidatus Thioglobus sp.]